MSAPANLPESDGRDCKVANGRGPWCAALRRWWHARFAAVTCTDPGCPDHGDDPWTLVSEENVDE